jgi:hypothetical protein
VNESTIALEINGQTWFNYDKNNYFFYCHYCLFNLWFVAFAASIIHASIAISL